jgi:hypothetical protein
VCVCVCVRVCMMRLNLIENMPIDHLYDNDLEMLYTFRFFSRICEPLRHVGHKLISRQHIIIVSTRVRLVLVSVHKAIMPSKFKQSTLTQKIQHKIKQNKIISDLTEVGGPITTLRV